MKTMPRGALKVTCSLGATLQASGRGTAIADCAGYLREGSGYVLLPFRRMYGPSRRRTTNRMTKTLGWALSLEPYNAAP